MNSQIAITVIVEGQTELRFVKDILAPYLGAKGIFMTPIMISKPGQKGGDVRFARAINDIGKHLKQRNDTFVSLLIDYYGIGRDWPGLNDVIQGSTPAVIAGAICKATKAAVDKELSEYHSTVRFVPNIIVHEFEALLFSDAATLAQNLQVHHQQVLTILEKCGEPESIDNSPHSAPSKRLAQLCGRYKKTSMGITIAKAIGIDKMRDRCPVFNGWLIAVEALKRLK